VICPNCPHVIDVHDPWGCTMLDCNCEEKAEFHIDPPESAPEPQPEEQAA